MQPVRDAFERALADSGEIDAAIATVEAWLDGDPGAVLASAYLGSLNAMKAGAALLPWVKLRHAAIAAELLDRAYERRFGIAPAAGGPHDPPADLVVLLLRGIAYASFPPFLGHGPAARESLEQAARHPAFPMVPEAHRTLALSHLSRLRDAVSPGM